MSRNLFKRAIVRRVITWDERASLSQRGMSWSRTFVHTMTAECGHKRVLRGYADPPKHIICKFCEKGEAPVPVVGSLGVIDKTGDSKGLDAFVEIVAAVERGKKS